MKARRHAGIVTGNADGIDQIPGKLVVDGVRRDDASVDRRRRRWWRRKCRRHKPAVTATALTDFEGQISAVLNRLKPFNDPKSPKVVQLTAAQVAVNALLRFIIEKGSSPNEITDDELKALDA
jgi:hypothetical protein